MRYFDVWNKHQYWMDIIYVKRFLFLVSFSFWSLRIWHFLYLFLLHFGFTFSMKGVCCYDVWWVYVWIKQSFNFFCLGIDIYDSFLHMVHEKKCKNANSSHKVPIFLEWLNRWKMQHVYAYFHKRYTFNKWKH
jgi:hypothetical protein